jgi:hypothetical protein
MFTHLRSSLICTAVVVFMLCGAFAYAIQVADALAPPGTVYRLTDCSYINHSKPSVSGLTGFATPWYYYGNTGSKELMLQAWCDESSFDAFIDAGELGAGTHYTYERGYRWTGTEWEPFTLTTDIHAETSQKSGVCLRMRETLPIG